MNLDIKTTRQTLAAPEIAEYLGISRSGAYNLLHAASFPSFHIGGRVMVTRKAFEKWLDDQQAETCKEKQGDFKKSTNGKWC